MYFKFFNIYTYIHISNFFYKFEYLKNSLNFKFFFNKQALPLSRKKKKSTLRKKRKIFFSKQKLLFPGGLDVDLDRELSTKLLGGRTEARRRKWPQQ